MLPIRNTWLKVNGHKNIYNAKSRNKKAGMALTIS